LLTLLALVLAVGYAVFNRFPILPQGSTALSWVAPVDTETNEPLERLAGYNIHCWGDAGRYTNVIHIEDPSVTKYVIDGLSPGRYQCAVSAFTEEGIESALSNVVARTIE